MKPSDRTRLTSALRGHVGKIAADLQAKMRAPGKVRIRAEQLHKDEKVADNFEVWTDLLSRRAAVLWVLKSVYIRVLEDRGLLSPGRLLDLEAQQLFEKLAPNLGETAFLRWIYRDLASADGGLPELFSQEPAEVALPSDELSRGLITFWRHKDADTGGHITFADEKFEGELMGDLYQELDPVVKDRFALCQTPDFVRGFILDRTLTPAIEAFGAENVRLLDPACGSGHFLIDGLKRLVTATAEKHPEWQRAKVVQHALGRVVGVDLNDYACALARTRLIMTAAELSGVASLAEAAKFHPHVYWADGLEQVERDEVKEALQFGLFEKVEEKPRAVLTRSDVRAALRKVFGVKFHAVVANPPYITEKDAARKDYHREKSGKKQRYVSAYREYSLGSPFTERCFQLAEKDGYVGIITSNNFMKREFGKPLIEKVLAGLDLTLVVDTSQAYIPFHGTPTVLLFGRNRAPQGQTVRAVMGKRGESGTPDDPAKGKVWSSIAEGWSKLGFENEYVSVADLPRETLGKHPWSLGGGGASELKARIETHAQETLDKRVLSIGRVAHTGADGAYVADRATLFRRGLPGDQIAVFVEGDKLRDWSLSQPTSIAFPYRPDLQQVDDRPELPVIRYLWPFRAMLWERREPGGTHREIGFTWHQFSRFHPERYGGLGIAFAFVATHNHFVLDRGGKVFNRSAPVIKLPADATEDDHLALLGLLNSSTACFWMKQVFHNKGAGGIGGGYHTEMWSVRLEHDATKIQMFPVVASAARTIIYARRLDELARTRSSRSMASAISGLSAQGTGQDLRAAMSARNAADREDFQKMVAIQEELDWLCYGLYGLDPSPDAIEPDQIERLLPVFLPWCLTQAARDQAIRKQISNGGTSDELPTVWFERHGWEPALELPESLSLATQTRIQNRRARTRENPALTLIESANFKRRWYKPDYEKEEKEALELWLADRVEQTAKERGKPFSLEQIASALQDDARVLAVCEVLSGRTDFNLSQLVSETLQSDAVPNHRFHIYKLSGLLKREAWEKTWEDQRAEDAGEKVTPAIPPAYGSGDFLKTETWQLRGKLDVPKERFIAFTEVPGRTGVETLYGWAGWTPLQRIKALLAIDEDLEDATVPLPDRIALLDSAWRLLPDATREDPAVAARLKAELQSLVGPTGPSRELLTDWQTRFPPPNTRASRTKRTPPKPDADDEET